MRSPTSKNSYISTVAEKTSVLGSNPADVKFSRRGGSMVEEERWLNGSWRRGGSMVVGGEVAQW
jgi:hypothetical protein